MMHLEQCQQAIAYESRIHQSAVPTSVMISVKIIFGPEESQVLEDITSKENKEHL